MTDQHPITPPPELVRQWDKEAATAPIADQRYIATQAARWGADQELESCCEWIYKLMDRGLEWSMDLRNSRRPKPPSLAEQALDTLRSMQIEPVILNGINVNKDVMNQYSIIRRALERLQELDQN